MKYLIITLLFFSSGSLSAQTWSGEMANLFYSKCSKCHHSGGIAPVSLTTYAEVSPMAGAIYDAVAQDRMPPWPPNNNYQQYVHNRALSATEKTSLLSWLSNGIPEGNPSATPPPPVFSTSTLLGAGDLTLQIPNYMSKAQNGQDDYVCFSIPSGLTQNRTIKSIEIVPGNRQIVHHALIYIDPDATSITDTVGGDCGSPSSPDATLVMGYTPGSTPLTLPTTSPMKFGIPFPQGSNVVFAMHYPDGSYGQWDSTKVIFHFYPPNEMNVRTVLAAPILQNWTFALPPNQITNLTATYPSGSGGVPADISVMSVFPHMHNVGKKIKAYGLNPAGDTIRFIDIPHWDFHWQDFYFFKNIKKVPFGSTLKAEAMYDNTTANPHNPFNPPQLITAGLNTADEMFLVYFHFTQYQAGDENFDMEALMTASLSELNIEKGTLSVYPNPSAGTFRMKLPPTLAQQKLSIRLYDVLGNLVQNWSDVPTAENWEWNGTNSNGEVVPKGIYMLSVNINGVFYSERLVKM